MGIYHKIFDSSKVGGRKKAKKEEPVYESVRVPPLSGTLSPPGPKGMPVYASMKDLRPAQDKSERREDDYEICVFSSPAGQKESIQTANFHVYENTLCLPGGGDRAPNPEPLFHYVEKEDVTRDFTSEPQRNVHKPVAIKGSNDLIARFGTSSTDKQQSLPQYGLFISSDPIKKPCKWRFIHQENGGLGRGFSGSGQSGKNSSPHQSSFDSKKYYENLDFSQSNHGFRLLNKSKSDPSIYRPSQLHASTGQHLHTTSASALNLPDLPLYHLRPPAPVPLKLAQSYFMSKGKRKTRLAHKLDANLPIIYEAHNQEEEIYVMMKSDRETFNLSLDEKESLTEIEDLSISVPSPGCHSNKSQSSDNLDSGLSEGINTPLVSPMSGPPSPNSDSLLGDPQAPLSLDDLKISKENEALTKENDFSTNCMEDIFRCDYANKIYEINDRFLADKHNEALNGSFDLSNFCGTHSTPIKSEHLNSDALSENKNMSSLLRNVVEKNLFRDSWTTKSDSSTSNLSFKSSHLCNITRRHSFASIKDISKRDPKHSPQKRDPVSPAAHGTRALKKSHSFVSLSPAIKTRFVPPLREPACVYPPWGREAGRTKGPGRDGGHPGVGDCPVGRDEGSFRPWKGESSVGRCGKWFGRPGAHGHFSDLPPSSSSFVGNSTLPGGMGKEDELSREERRLVAHSVPRLQPLGKHAGVRDPESPRREVQTEQQRLRQAESLFRLQHLLDQTPSPPTPEERDWSLEAVIDESQNEFDSPSSSKSGAESSEDCQDTFSVCTLDSDLADSVYIGPKLCDKIRQVSEDKMLAKLRRSFRKKDKCVPKVGIFMFVDNPMYVSPEAKKEAKIVTFTPSKRKKSFLFKSDKNKPDKENDALNGSSGTTYWYVGNPIYNSPAEFKQPKSSSVSLHTAQCEKENIINYQAAKSISNGLKPSQSRVPLKDIWIQANPCYESPGVKNGGIYSPPKRRIDSPKKANAKKPLPPLPPAVKERENHYLTPILSKKTVPYHEDILDLQKYIDHEYCTIPGEEPDSWVSHLSALSKRSPETPNAKRNLNFGGKGVHGEGHKTRAASKDVWTAKPSKEGGNRTKKSPSIASSRIWREGSGRSLPSTPKERRDGHPCFGDRGYKTPRSIKRGKMNKNVSKVSQFSESFVS